MSDIRYDPIHDTHVIIAPERLHRPDCFMRESEVEETNEHCPFCEGNEALTPHEIFAIRDNDSVANEKGWQTRVVPNLYKALQIETPHQHHYGAFEYWKGFGAHEVIIDTPKHHTSMTQWSEKEVIFWLKTLSSRVADLRRDHRIAHISLFKNEGIEAGATQTHAHTQLIGLPIIPKMHRAYYQRSYEHYHHHGQALLAEKIANEEANGERIVAIEGDFTAYCPYASAYPFEVMISSKKALGQIDALSDKSMEVLAPLLLRTLKKLKDQLGYFDFNLSIATPPLQEGTVEQELLYTVNKACRFAIRIMPRLYKHAGFEVSTGIIINPVSPEFAAKLLREGNDE
ncbi:UTP--glucose-1-phosphate uridylyltransferase [bacterium]|nr:UTP--glucose-1-phosphate uridylyltransferase [bacterium]MBU1957181.1 UTP--glucose-1-phosphate uridylyltransferase [bacterium]